MKKNFCRYLLNFLSWAPGLKCHNKLNWISIKKFRQYEDYASHMMSFYSRWVPTRRFRELGLVWCSYVYSKRNAGKCTMIDPISTLSMFSLCFRLNHAQILIIDLQSWTLRLSALLYVVILICPVNIEMLPVILYNNGPALPAYDSLMWHVLYLVLSRVLSYHFKKRLTWCGTDAVVLSY